MFPANKSGGLTWSSVCFLCPSDLVADGCGSAVLKKGLSHDLSPGHGVYCNLGLVPGRNLAEAAICMGNGRDIGNQNGKHLYLCL